MDWTVLAQSLRRPRPFDPGDGLFWADPYISEHVLLAHLDSRTDDASRPLPVIEREVAWIDSQFSTAGRGLDLGCGPGLHSLLLADKGWQMTGIDAAPTAIAYAQKEAADAGLSLDYHQADFQQTAFPLDLDLILIAYGTLGTLSPAAARRLLGRCRAALKPGGKLIFDTFRQSWWQRQRAAGPTSAWEVLEHDGFWAAGPHLVLNRSYVYPALRTFGRVFTIVQEDRIRRYPFWYRWYDPEHLVAELLAGWSSQYYGNLTGQRLTKRSAWVAVVACR